MLKILVLTKNHPVEITTTAALIQNQIGEGVEDIIVNSPQFIADMVSKVKKIPYIQTYYPALRAYKKIEQYMNESDLDILITVGTIDRLDKNQYDAIIGLNNPDVADYDTFDEDFNTTNMTVMNLKEADIMFNDIKEVIHFLRIVINNYRKENNNDLQQTTTGSDR